MTARPLPPIDVFDTLDSTNSEARRRAERGEVGPRWIMALEQTAGRGRRGRAWESHGGDLCATLLMATSRQASDAARVAFVAALAVWDLLAAFAPPDRIRIKWPNDVLIDGRKAAGVLVESGAAPEGLWLAVGFGVNLAGDVAGAEPPRARLADALRADVPECPGPQTALDRLARAFDRRLQAWDHQGFDAILQDWTERAAGLGGPCVARLGAETLHGVACGLEPDGALRLKLANGELRRIAAGDVFFEAA